MESDDQNIKSECLSLAMGLRLKDVNGDQSLTKEQVLEAAKAFYEWIEGTEQYLNACQEAINESIKRIDSFRNKGILQMRLKTSSISDDQYEFACKLIDATIKLVNMQSF